MQPDSLCRPDLQTTGRSSPRGLGGWGQLHEEMRSDVVLGKGDVRLAERREERFRRDREGPCFTGQAGVSPEGEVGMWDRSPPDCGHTVPLRAQHGVLILRAPGSH